MARRTKKRTWNAEEDQKLIELVQIKGPQYWNNIAESLENRTGKQCRERWHNQLDPSLKRMNWSNAEEWILFLLQRRSPNKWSEFVGNLYGRSDNAIKNYWNTALSHRVAKFQAALENYFAQVKAQHQLSPRESGSESDYLKHVESNLLTHYIEEARNQYLNYLRDKID